MSTKAICNFVTVLSNLDTTPIYQTPLLRIPASKTTFRPARLALPLLG